MAGQYFYKKISKAVTEDRIIEDFDLLLGNSISRSSFNSSEDLQKYLTEGAMLNVNSFGSKILSIPSGEYLVWLTDAGHTMLVPASESQKTKEVFENTRASYEVFTNDLLKSFIGVEKTLTEAENKDDVPGDEDEQKKENEEKDISFTLNVDRSDIDRTSILQAMEDQGLTETELAERVGVDTPAISRLLRKPKPGPGDPGGRNPSIGLAARICSVLSMDPRSAFPDIFSKDERPKAKKTKANRASGSGTGRSKKAFKGGGSL
jgi:DNA-binding XRE family transcriptional regulator